VTCDENKHGHRILAKNDQINTVSGTPPTVKKPFMAGSSCGDVDVCGGEACAQERHAPHHLDADSNDMECDDSEPCSRRDASEMAASWGQSHGRVQAPGTSVDAKEIQGLYHEIEQRMLPEGFSGVWPSMQSDQRLLMLLFIFVLQLPRRIYLACVQKAHCTLFLC
jgi:hypothetical protein